MDDQNYSRLEQLLQDNIELTQENNKILRSLQRTMRWSFWGKLLLWIIVLVLPFIFLGPLLHTLIPASNSEGNTKSLFGLPSADQIQSLLKTYQHEVASTTGH